jgi:carboxylesterase type B
VGFEDASHPASGGREPGALRPVRVFAHGGFLQFGSTSGSMYNQQFFAAEHFGEVRVLLGHR